MKKEELWGWLFQYNPYTDEYIAVTKQNYQEFCNGNSKLALRSNSMPKLEALVIDYERNTKINLGNMSK